MSLVVPWLVFPALLAVLACGCGLLLERAAGVRLPAGLLLPAGFAALAAAGLFPPTIPGAAHLATPLVVLLAATGLVLGRHRLRDGLDRCAAAAGLAVFAATGAPVFLSGRATFAGYIKLDDTATYLAMLDRFMGHGYDTARLAPSTYEATLNTSLALGYPMGSLVPLGVGHQLVRTDSAWLWQPYLSFLAALLALGLYALLEPLVVRRSVRAAVAFVAAQSALLYGYILWGGIKEVSAAALLVLGCALVPGLLSATRPRETLPLAATVAAFVGALSVGGVLWVVPLGIVAAVALVWRGRSRRTIVVGSSLAGVSMVLALPALAAARHWLSHAGGFKSGSELANLGHPLDRLQIVGIWPAGDFRDTPESLGVTHMLIALVGITALAGVAVAVFRRAHGPLAYLLSALGGAALFDVLGSPWIAAKGLATGSPALLALGLAGVGSLATHSRRTAALGLVGLAIAGGVLWSNVLAYRDVWLAPNARLAELETIGHRFAGQGPALMTEYEPYGVRHFLRLLDPEGASELRRSEDPLATGQLLQTGDSADIDEFGLATLLPYRTLVLRRSPVASVPPSAYRLVWQGRYYTVWQRVSPAPRIIEHLSLGNRFHAAAVPQCRTVLALARKAGPGGRLEAVERPANAAISLPGDATFTFGQYGERTDAVYLSRPQVFRQEIRVSETGLVEFGVDGTVQGRLTLSVDGRRVASIRSKLNWPNQYEELGALTLGRGTHSVTLAYGGTSWLPGTQGTPAFGTGPLVVGFGTAARAPITVPVAEARTLCHRSLDWIEALAG